MTDTALFHIVYCSRNLIGAVEGDQEREIRSILEKARSNNSHLSVTGALLYNDGFFAQVLEGPLSGIQQIFEKIQRDNRHGDVTVLECSPTKARDFPDWSMAHVHPDSDAQASLSSETMQRAIQDPKADGHAVLKLLCSLVVEQD